MMNATTSHRFFRRECLAVLALVACSLLTTIAQAQTAADVGFRNSVNPPPADYKGPVFQLSHDYPQQLPKVKAPWLDVKVDFTTTKPAWKDFAPYLDAILQVVIEEQNPQLTNDAGWSVKVGGETRWFHVPWMAYNPSAGREYTHGCTNERTATYENFVGPIALGSGKTKETFESWAFGVYNPAGAYTIGQTFPKSGVPQISTKNPGIPAGLPFREGTLVAKVLFATATPEQVPFLKNSPEWIVNRHKYPGGIDPKTGKKVPPAIANERELGPVRMVQMDVAVVDPRSPMRWVFGTFAYNGTLAGADAPWWKRISPVGLQWGSDPWAFPALPKDISQPVIQSVLAPIDIFEHDGANGRLAGPVDNPQSSCVSCHQGAFAARPVGTVGAMGTNIPPIFGFKGLGLVFNAQNAAYFQNTPFPSPYPDPAYLTNYSLDTSLQFQVGFNAYASWLQSQAKKSN